MSHTCSSALIRCMDFRFTDAINKWLEEKGIMNDCDMISVAGIVKVIADNPESPEAKYVLKQFELSKKLHATKTLYLMHHTDCGAYGGHKAFANLEEEKAKYLADMEKAREVIKSVAPDLEVKFVLADIKEDGSVMIEEI